MNEPKTVRVRIGVAVDAAGRYKAVGWGGAVDWVVEEQATGTPKRFGGPVEVHWFELDVPFPVSVTPAEEG